MSDCSELKPGDPAMLVLHNSFHETFHLTIVEVEKVYKNGQIILTNGDKYRQNGSEIGEASRFSRGPELHPWDDEVLAEHNRLKARDKSVSSLFTFGEALVKLSRSDREEAARVWDAIPQEVRDIVGAGQ
jgi:hypothetical protein